MSATAIPVFPTGYQPGNMLANVVEVLFNRGADGEVSKESIACAIANHFGDGDYSTAEARIWDTYIGPLLDDIETDLALDAGYTIR